MNITGIGLELIAIVHKLTRQISQTLKQGNVMKISVICFTALIGMLLTGLPSILFGGTISSSSQTTISRPRAARPHISTPESQKNAASPGSDYQSDKVVAPPFASETYNYPWKTEKPFEISFIDGLQGSYAAGEPIVFYVEGRSPIKIEALPEAGFNLAATITDTTRSKDIQGAAIKYDESKRLWEVSFTAPKDNTKSYEILIFLYCAVGESPCAEVYGRAAQTVKVLPVKIF